MKFTMEHVFNWPHKKITDLLANGEYLVPMDEVPNVSEYRRIETVRKGDKIFSKNEWCVHGKIPSIAQKIIRPEMLTFIEDTVWDDNTTTFTTRIIPHFFKNQFICRTSSSWQSAGNSVTKRIFSGSLEIRIPIIGPPVEKAIIDQLKASNDKNAIMVRKALAEKIGSPTA